MSSHQSADVLRQEAIYTHYIDGHVECLPLRYKGMKSAMKFRHPIPLLLSFHLYARVWRYV